MKPALAAQHQPQPADDSTLREVQQNRLRKLHDELVAEGADSAKQHLSELQARAETWPE